jgi:hypothetical protein
MMQDIENIRVLNTKEVKKIQASVAEMSKTFATLKATGIHEDILMAYLVNKTKLSKHDIRQVLESQEDFYKKLSGLMVKTLPEE